MSDHHVPGWFTVDGARHPLRHVGAYFLEFAEDVQLPSQTVGFLEAPGHPGRNVVLMRGTDAKGAAQYL